MVASTFSVSFDSVPAARPVLRRLATTVESPAGCIRKGCKCDITDAGFRVISSATTHVECPSTTIKGIQAELASPQRFYRFIMQPGIEFGDIDKHILNRFMLECFEFPFESPSDVRLQNKMKVKVELSRDFRARARDQLSMFTRRIWHQLGIYRIVDACASLFDHKVHVQVPRVQVPRVQVHPHRSS